MRPPAPALPATSNTTQYNTVILHDDAAVLSVDDISLKHLVKIQQKHEKHLGSTGSW